MKPSDIESEILRELFAYWKDKRKERAMPSRADLDPVEIPRLLPNLLLFERDSNSDRLCARLVGTKVVQSYGKDYTGAYLDELDLGDQRPAVMRDYLACLRSKRPAVAHRTFWNIRGTHFRFERLLLPLSDDDAVVNMVLAGLDFHELRGD